MVNPVTLPTGVSINTATSGDRTTVTSFRKFLASLFGQSTPGVPTQGILDGPGTPLDVTTSASAMEYDVSAGFALVTRTNKGAYIVGDDTGVTVTGDAGDASNPRIDVVYIRQPDPELGDSGVAQIGVKKGTASSSPVEPTLDGGSLKLRSFTVPAGAATSDECTDRDDRPAVTALYMSTDNLIGTIDADTINGRTIHVSTSDPGPGDWSDGDIWLKREA